MSRKLTLLVSVLLVASVSLPMFQPVASQVVTVTNTLGWQNNFGSNPACVYPFNPYYCNQGPPVTIQGYLTTDGSCTFLYDGQVNYAVWNLPRYNQYPSGNYQVYGFVYPSWPLGQQFPPYPFQTTTCMGVPLWAVPPYIQSWGYNGNSGYNGNWGYNGNNPSPCSGQSCWSNGQTATVYGWLPAVGDSSGCVNLYTNGDQSNIKAILWNVGSNYLPGYVVVTGVYQQMNSCGGTVLNVLWINSAYQ